MTCYYQMLIYMDSVVHHIIKGWQSSPCQFYNLEKKGLVVYCNTNLLNSTNITKHKVQNWPLSIIGQEKQNKTLIFATN